MGKVQQVLHRYEGVAESFCRGDPLLRINQQHLLQQAHKLSAVRLLHQQVATFQIHHQVHLENRNSTDEQEQVKNLSPGETGNVILQRAPFVIDQKVLLWTPIS